MSTVTLMQSFTVTTCASCGIAFAAPESFLQKRREDKGTFYCPNGHSLSYTTSETGRLRNELATKQRMLDEAYNRQLAIAAELAKEQRAKKRLSKRLESGVCPVPGCKRHFANLQRHIATEHKGAALPPAENEQKALPPGKAVVQ
jgi:hypothetical protein